MSLKLMLKPHERLIIGGAVVRNGGKTAELHVENTVPILRGKEILSQESADSPCKRIYLAIQLMYIDEKNLSEYHAIYWELVREVLAAAPSTAAIIDRINELVLDGTYYQALKKTKELLRYEEELLSHARESLQHV